MPPQSDGTRGFLVWGILLRLDWEWLREGRLKVARGRSWQPEIGMEHASRGRGRRSGNKGVGARWRGRFRIFSARHCSRTKVSHAENSGMTMVVVGSGSTRGVFRCAGRPREWSCGAVPPREWMARGRLVFVFSLEGCSESGWGAVSHACRRGSGSTRGSGFSLVCLVPVVRAYVARACVGRWSGHSAPCRHRVTARGLRRFGFFGGGFWFGGFRTGRAGWRGRRSRGLPA